CARNPLIVAAGLSFYFDYW
nr:immunoglobulin heavy chain junction region [Macaca mulatta]MOV49677.1 immunoglobulin heavy chain junction region [Macaca mulatta]MOV49997.1 immunoglobulin heavy chain junction region [Macaca mulatta]MOV50001.1 immunoglobulin heavy chain junction region [Macaca mulatta]MOV50374.1 immunoglobulin heavy chain junction region [Macaca mulatta]